MPNFTGVGSHKTFKQLFCSEELTGGIHYHLFTTLSVLNTVLSISALLGNILILVALRKESSLHPPTKLLFRCLASSDFCVGILSEPLTVVYWMSVVKKRWDICRYALTFSFITGFVLCSVSLLTLTAVSVDRLLALLLGLRYRHVVTFKRTYLAVSVFWVVSILGTTMYFWNYLITVWYGYIGILLCLLISIFSYVKIFLTLRHHQAQVLARIRPSQTSPLNLARYRKAVSGALWLQLTLLVCYLPYGIGDALIAQRGLTSHTYIAREFTVTLIYLNSSLNPLLYCWKVGELRQAVKDTIRQLCCSFC